MTPLVFQILAALAFVATCAAWEVCCAAPKPPVEIERITIVGTVPCAK